MSPSYRRIAKVPNYLRAFGWADGMRLLLGVERGLPSKSQRIREYRVPGFPAPLCLRETISDHAIFWQCIVRRQYAVNEFPQSQRLGEDYRRAVAEGRRPLIIDCGGNIGLSAAWFANEYPQAVVFVIEPDAANLEMLKRNTHAFGGRVVVLHGGIWNKSTYLRVSNPTSGSAAFQVEETSEDAADALRAYTIEEVCQQANDARPFIVKVDIEGAQKQLFSGNPGWVSRANLIMLELDDWLMPWQGTSRPFFQAISEHPFDYLMSGETIFCFRDTRVEDQVTPGRPRPEHQP